MACQPAAVDVLAYRSIVLEIIRVCHGKWRALNRMCQRNSQVIEPWKNEARISEGPLYSS